MEQGSTCESSRQERDVSLLVGGDDLDVLVNSGIEASVGEVLLGELGEAVAVECILEVLKRQGVVEDITVGRTGGRGSISRGKRSSRCQSSERKAQECLRVKHGDV